MESKSSVTDTVFVIKEEEEHCFLFDGNDPLELLRVLYRQADETDGLSREEITEVLEGVIPGKLRSI